ncbi:MAG: hypothetical protein IPO45_03690 [Saprospiraceae bacterium]|nr:hypothetical protein [Candidatus Brachybacter algidus]
MSEENKNDIEHQMIRGQLLTHSTLSKISGRINDMEAFIFGINDALIEKAFFLPNFYTQKLSQLRKT